MIKKMIKICVNNKKSVKLERGTVRAFTLIEIVCVSVVSCLTLRKHLSWRVLMKHGIAQDTTCHHFGIKKVLLCLTL